MPTVARKSFRMLALVLVLMLGVLAGIGAFTFGYAEGFSYFSADPKACVNCHVMNEQYDSWLKSPHHAAATCVDCHLPHDFVGKYIAKAENGYHHSMAFTLQNFHDPIQIKPRNAKILNDNCLRCHANLTADLIKGGPGDRTPAPTVHGDDAVSCVHCHRNVAHGARN